ARNRRRDLRAVVVHAKYVDWRATDWTPGAGTRGRRASQVSAAPNGTNRFHVRETSAHWARVLASTRRVDSHGRRQADRDRLEGASRRYRLGESLVQRRCGQQPAALG